MRKLILPLLAAVAVPAPALADSRAEVRGGVISSQGTTEATYGAAIGFDADFGPLAFYGLELSGDKIDRNSTKVAYALTGRLGVKAGPFTRVFGAAGYSSEPCDRCEASWHAGAGLEQSLGGPLYAKGEYRHYFPGNGVADSDSFVGGIGIRF